MEQNDSNIANKHLNTKTTFYLAASGDQGSNLSLNAAHFFKAAKN